MPKCIACYQKQLAKLSCIAMTLWLLTAVAFASAGEIESVAVAVDSQQESILAESVKHRMKASAETIADSLLVGKRIAEVSQHQHEYEAIIADVFDRILAGYTVQSVKLDCNEQTQVTVMVKPWGDTIRSVRVETDFAGLSPHVTDFIKSHMADYERTIENILVGLSTDSIDWAQVIAKRTVNEQLADDLPEFKVGFDVEGGQDTLVRLTFLPQGAVVKSVSVDLSSSTIPHLILWELRPKLENAANDLVGIPVDYVARHSAFLCEKTAEELKAKYPFIQKHGIVITPTINVGTNTVIQLQVETTKYRINMEGYLEMGKKEDNASFKLHTGYFMTPRQETFLDITFAAGDMRWEFLPAWSYHANERTWLGIKYNINQGEEWLFLEEKPNGRWRLRGELCPTSGETEIGIRYRLHDFFSLEYVIAEDDKWLRLIGNL